MLNIQPFPLLDISLTVNVTVVDIFFSLTFTHRCTEIPHTIKKNRLPHAPHNNSVTHRLFMKAASTLIVLQPSFTYTTARVSLQLD